MTSQFLFMIHLTPRERQQIEFDIWWSVSVCASAMPAYHSSFHSAKVDCVGNVALLPFKASSTGGTRGPVPVLPKGDPAPDVIDEALTYFKANVFFRTYEIRSGRRAKWAGDRTLSDRIENPLFPGLRPTACSST